MDLQMVERGEGCGVGNGLDRGSVDVVVDDVDKIPARDMLAFQVLLLKATSRWNTSLVVSSNTVVAERGPVNNGNCEMGQQAA